MDIGHSCCFTGHRPEKLHVEEKTVIQQLDAAIAAAINDGFITFISGMAKGVDIWAAELVLEHRRLMPNINLICAVPYAGFGLHWKDNWTKRFKDVLCAADHVQYVCEAYSRSVYQCRNEWMVDHASLLIAAYTGEKGGTRNTIKYAMQKDCTIKFLNLPLLQ